jgi:DNA-binding transcriptional LysR family regulator
MDRFASMTLFVRVVEAGSFSSVAREAGLSQPTVSKQIAALERQLGVRLLQRSTRSVALTDAGRRYYERCARLIAEVEELEVELTSHHVAPTGMLRLNAPIALGRLWLCPILQSYLEQNPGVKVDLSLTDAYIDLVEHGIDVAIRVNGTGDSALVARRLGSSPRIVVASPEYLARHGAPEHPEELIRHNCLVFTRFSGRNSWTFKGHGRTVTVEVSGGFSSDNADSVREMTLRGFGITSMPRYLLNEPLSRGELVWLLKGYTGTPADISAVYASARYMPARVRRFLDFVCVASAGLNEG